MNNYTETLTIIRESMDGEPIRVVRQTVTPAGEMFIERRTNTILVTPELRRQLRVAIASELKQAIVFTPVIERVEAILTRNP